MMRLTVFNDEKPVLEAVGRIMIDKSDSSPIVRVRVEVAQGVYQNILDLYPSMTSITYKLEDNALPDKKDPYYWDCCGVSV